MKEGMVEYGDEVDAYTREVMVRSLAAEIYKKKINQEESEGGLLTTFSMDLYVMTPEEFAKTVHREAERLAYYLMKRREG